jgi:DNA-binding transcriptional ArsR family regulator
MPPTSDDPLDLLLRALADPTRRLLLDRLRDAPGATLTALTAGLPGSRQALSKHLGVLEDAGLLVPVWRGREKLHFLDPAPLQALPRRWVTASAREDAAAAGRLRAALAEAAPPSRRQAAPKRSTADPIATALAPEAAPGLRGQPLYTAEELAAAVAFLAQTGRAVEALLAALGAAEGRAVPAAGGFSLAAHLWHLADIETLGWRPRFERILAETRPQLAGVDGDRLAVEHRYEQRPWRGAAQLFVRERRRTLAALARFDSTTLQRSVVFGGTRTRAGAVLGAAVAHDREHREAMLDHWHAERAAGR